MYFLGLIYLEIFLRGKKCNYEQVLINKHTPNKIKINKRKPSYEQRVPDKRLKLSRNWNVEGEWNANMSIIHNPASLVDN